MDSIGFDVIGDGFFSPQVVTDVTASPRFAVKSALISMAMLMFSCMSFAFASATPQKKQEKYGEKTKNF